MNIKQYIASGILESYLLDEVTPQERLEVERMVDLYPELKEELKQTESTLEALVKMSARSPRKELKEEMLSKINPAAPAGKTAVLSERQLPFWKYAAAASWVIALGASYMAYAYYSKWTTTTLVLNDLMAQNQRVAQDYNTVNQKLEKIQSDLSIMESPAYKKVVLKGTANDVSALASVYWNASSQEVFLSIQSLREIAQENQFQLWAIVEGIPVDVGVFDAGFQGLLKMKNVKGATAFAVTIEPRGGKDAPTLDTMQVIGPVAG